ncbi:MAG: FecR domain-containing protein, partial [Terriglobia bacterium]
MKWRPKLAVMILAVVGMASVRLRAQAEASPGVARVSLIHGEVSTERADTGDWAAATLNAPLVTGDSLSTGGASRAELQLDYANILRLGEHTEAKIADLSGSHIQVQLAQGLADYTVLSGNQADLEIDTPNVAVHPTEPGIYRVEVFSNSHATVIVRKGNAQVSTPQGSTTVKNGELMRIEGTDNPQYQIVGAPKTDAWDQWNNQRNHVIEDAKSYQHTNKYYTGAEDMDAYGHWVNVQGYNWCWTPYVDAGWIPYNNGRWAWEPY